MTRLLTESEAPIVLLVAPAGYGKTTLARQWLTDKPHVWHSATGASADVAALAARLADAGSSLTESDPSTLDERLHLSRDPEEEVEVLADFVGRCFAGAPRDAWLAIDDYHLLMDSEAAEVLVASLPKSAPIRLLVTSRRRPSWASARRIMYGEIFEVGRDDLAMDADEANKLLNRHSDASAPALVALADGWPAVIGMAALTGAAVAPEGAMDDALYDFFAQECFNTADVGTQQLLCRVAVLPRVERPICIELFGKDSVAQLHWAEHLGLLSRAGTDWQIHPLLRQFLLMRFTERDPKGLEATARSVFKIAVATKDWDTAYSVAAEFGMPDLLEDLIRAGLDALLTVGRVATLRRWVDAANAYRISSPVVRLAEAEVVFREGKHLRAEVLATAAVGELSEPDPLRARSFFRIGQAAYFNEHYEAALESFEQCVRLSRDKTLEREARWAAFIAALDSYHSDTRKYLQEFARVRESTVDDAVRMANAELMLAMRQEGVTEALEAQSGATHLVDRATDPMIRTAFWNAYGWALALNCRYEEAQRAAANELDDAETYRLSFVEPHAQLLAALASVGVRELIAAEAFLERVFEFARVRDDAFLSVNGSAVLARLHIARGDNAKAAEVTGAYKTAKRSILHAEYLGIRSVVLAALGENEEAREAISAVPDEASHGEGLAFAQLARVIIASNEGSLAVEAAAEAISTLQTLGQLDVFVTGCRAYPPLVDLSIASSGKRFTEEMLRRSNDFDLAKQFGLNLPSVRVSDTSLLSRREQQVLDLVAEGRTNQEVGRLLFISPVTVKAHLRHIYEKLGVRNRVEAARLSKSQIPETEIGDARRMPVIRETSNEP
ncbi:MAG: LuxR C-terminal-related transcriptional regulator [Gaiellaceae bacterium]